MNNKKPLLITLVAFLSVVGFFLLISYLMYQSQAVQDKVNISISPKNETIPVGEEQQVSFIIQPESAGKKLAGVKLMLQGENIVFTKINSCEGLSGEPSSIFSELKNEVNGTMAHESCAIFKSTNELPPAIKINASFKCSSSGNAKVMVDQSKSQIIGDTSNVLYQIAGGEYSFSCGGQVVDGPKVKAVFDPEQCIADVGKDCNYKLKMQSDGPMSGYYVRLKYDPEVIEAKSVTMDNSDVLGINNTLLAQSNTTITPTITPSPTPGTAVSTPTLYPTLYPTDISTPVTFIPSPTIASPSPIITSPTPTTSIPQCYQVRNVINNDDGIIELIYFCLQQKSKLPTSFEIGLNMKGKADGSGLFTVDDAQVVGPVPGYLYTVSSENGRYVIGKGGGGGAGKMVKSNMQITLRLQGVTKKPAKRSELIVRVGLGDGLLKETVYKNVKFTVDDKGLWRGSVEFEAPQHDRYKLLVKGQQHLQKKVCVDKPIEDYPGAYSCDKGKIAIKDGIQIFDFSQIIMLVGDFEPQDGLNNAYDQALVRNAIGQCDTDAAKLVDVNYDGCVNAIDHALMIAALSVRYDDK